MVKNMFEQRSRKFRFVSKNTAKVMVIQYVPQGFPVSELHKTEGFEGDSTTTPPAKF
jgi:hypothetical protein